MVSNVSIEAAALLVDLGLIVISATVFNYIFRVLKQPNLLAYIIAGIVIGPIGLGAIKLTLGGIPLYVLNLEDIKLLSELGIAFLLFSVGIETDFSKLKSIGKTAVIGTLLQVGIISTAVFFLTYYLNMLPFEESIYLGAILSFSSTMVVVKLLSDSRTIDTLHGRLMIGFLLMQDVLIVIFLPLLSNLAEVLSTAYVVDLAFSSFAMLAITFALMKYFFPKIYKFSAESSELLYLVSISTCFLFIFISQYVLGLPMALGAFLAGIALAPLPYNLQIYDEIRGFRDFFVTIFFVTLGIQLTFAFSTESIVLFGFMLFIALIFKPIVFYFITLLSGHGGKIALMVALSLGQVSEFSFILANQGLLAGYVSPELFSLTILTVAITMVITPYVFKYEEKVYKTSKQLLVKLPFLNDNSFLHREIKDLEKTIPLENHIVIVGGGTMGSSIAEALYKKVPVVVLDQNPEVLRVLMKKGINTIYGTAANRYSWEKLYIEKAKILIMAIPNVPAALKIIKYARTESPDLLIFAKAHYYSDALKLYQNGADWVVLPQILSSNLTLKSIGSYIETGKKNEFVNFKDEFVNYLKEKAKEETDMNMSAPPKMPTIGP